MRVVIDTNAFVTGLMLPASVPGRILAAAVPALTGHAPPADPLAQPEAAYEFDQRVA